MDGGSGSGKAAALAVLSRSDDPVAPASVAPASVAAPLRKLRLSTKLFREGSGNFSLGMDRSCLSWEEILFFSLAQFEIP
jgi:hypothetical protein